jgi:hypothetical protein
MDTNVIAVLVAALFGSATSSAAGQSTAALSEPPSPTVAVRPMTPDRLAWLKNRCAQLVAYFDYYGVSIGANSDGPRNHTRIRAVIDCERSNYRNGIDTMAALLKRKAFVVPGPGTPALEPQDVEAPDITDLVKR